MTTVMETAVWTLPTALNALWASLRPALYRSAATVVIVCTPSVAVRGRTPMRWPLSSDAVEEKGGVAAAVEEGGEGEGR